MTTVIGGIAQEAGKPMAYLMQQSLPDILDHIVDVDLAGHVMDEEDQHRYRAERQQDCDQQRDVGHKGNAAGLLRRSHSAQHDQAVKERGDESAQRHLIAPVAHEVA